MSPNKTHGKIKVLRFLPPKTRLFTWIASKNVGTLGVPWYHIYIYITRQLGRLFPINLLCFKIHLPLLTAVSGFDFAPGDAAVPWKRFILFMDLPWPLTIRFFVGTRLVQWYMKIWYGWVNVLFVFQVGFFRCSWFLETSILPCYRFYWFTR